MISDDWQSARRYATASGLDVATWVVLGIAALYLGARIAPYVLGRLLLWIS